MADFPISNKEVILCSVRMTGESLVANMESNLKLGCALHKGSLVQWQEQIILRHRFTNFAS
jgi:hypothetical protein